MFLDDNKIGYNTGNIEKYNTVNPLKKVMLGKFLVKLSDIVGDILNYTDGYCSMLDAGCGEAFVSNLLYDKFEKLQITGMDYSDIALEKARENNVRDIVFEHGDVTKLKYKDNSFDLVISTEVLEHVQDCKKALEEIYRVARKNIVLSVPNEPLFCLGNFFSGKNVKRFGNPIDHVNHWSYWGIKRFVEENLPHDIVIKQYNLFVWTIIVISKRDVNVS